ncbi:hypothetical protein AVEN_79281-1 [Araneus ventricosus]|uniref:Uncharacterized protein n=1 Tax=Araneus ventricosus TaxID=182803 RepID=A0A4Y2JQI5_ARAVE|nr:hypothetical protein AVEN_79281-1 [Araneus ventricosus]
METYITTNEIDIFLSNLNRQFRLVTNINALLSPIIFALIGFWLTCVFYNLTKLIHETPFQDYYSTFSTFFDILNYSFQFLILVLLSSEVPLTIQKMKGLVLKNPGEQFCVQASPRRSQVIDVNLLILKLEHFKEEATVTVIGVMKIDKSILFLSLGVVATYELLLVQLLEM